MHWQNFCLWPTMPSMSINVSNLNCKWATTRSFKYSPVIFVGGWGAGEYVSTRSNRILRANHRRASVDHSENSIVEINDKTNTRNLRSYPIENMIYLLSSGLDIPVSRTSRCDKQFHGYIRVFVKFSPPTQMKLLNDIANNFTIWIRNVLWLLRLIVTILYICKS